MNRISLDIAVIAVALATSTAAVAQEASARTVQYHSQDIVPIHAKLKYTTLIEVPPTEKIMEAATGDKDFWVVDVVGNFCFVHPAKAGTRCFAPGETIAFMSGISCCRLQIHRGERMFETATHERWRNDQTNCQCSLKQRPSPRQ